MYINFPPFSPSSPTLQIKHANLRQAKNILYSYSQEGKMFWLAHNQSSDGTCKVAAVNTQLAGCMQQTVLQYLLSRIKAYKRSSQRIKLYYGCIPLILCFNAIAPVAQLVRIQNAQVRILARSHVVVFSFNFQQ